MNSLRSFSFINYFPTLQCIFCTIHLSNIFICKWSSAHAYDLHIFSCRLVNVQKILRICRRMLLSDVFLIKARWKKRLEELHVWRQTRVTLRYGCYCAGAHMLLSQETSKWVDRRFLDWTSVYVRQEQQMAGPEADVHALPHVDKTDLLDPPIYVTGFAQPLKQHKQLPGLITIW